MAYDFSIVTYRPEYKKVFERLNRDWIEQYFHMESRDLEVLGDPETHILRDQGEILFLLHNGEPVGTVALKYFSPGVYEFTKMAVDPAFRNKGLGFFLGAAALDKARRLKATSVILYSNRILTSAIHVYSKLGFQEVPVDAVYSRGNIKMEYTFIRPDTEVTIRPLKFSEIPELYPVAKEIFLDTFRIYNDWPDLNAYFETDLPIQRFEKEFHEPESLYLVAESNGIQGYARIKKSAALPEFPANNLWEIERFYIHRHYHGTKMAAALMEECLQHIKSAGADAVYLGVWDKNPRAIRFYEKYGFKHFGEHPFILGTDHQTDQMYGLRFI